ncbi:MAG: CRISPR-associated helicase Cas3' [Bacillota bacterium]|nr:CRISPR-associated helicase Cas3' [Bacillota bacterium]
MNENYLAKSIPLEDIQSHTDNVLENYEKLKKLYPNINVNWKILYKSCLFHDLGKMNVKFQKRLKGKKCSGEIPHGVLSLAFINYSKLRKIEGYDNKDIKTLFHSIAYHHDREFDFEIEDIEEEIKNMEEQFQNFHYDKLGEEDKFLADTIEDSYFVKNDRIYENEESFQKYIMIKGLLNRLDYAASAYIDVESKNNFLQASLNNLMKEWQNDNKEAKWNKLQKYMIDNRNKNVIVIAQTGMGKTEAGLLWLGESKGFFTLPLKSAINSIYNRISKKIVKENIDDRVGLLDSDTYSKYIEIQEKNKNEEIDLEDYYNKTKQLSLPLTVCTLDQIFDFVYRYRGFEPKLATLSYSKVIIDEVQMYSADLLAYLIIGLYYISKFGGKFAILTATLPNIVIDLLNNEGIKFEETKVFTNNRIRHSIIVLDKEINTDDIIKKYKNNKILVICNTVKAARKIYNELVGKINDKEVNLLHSNFIKKDRAEKEDKIIEMGDKKNKSHGIWVATQIVEASLDIDFDLLFTELSDLNGLFQRMGRCYRDRDLDVDYNCFIFTGGQKGCSGVGKFIDEEIFGFSKKAIKDIYGEISEETKVKLVANLYTTDKLSKTQYYKDIIGNIDYVKSIQTYELDKNEMQKRFRNIDSVTIIPKNIYEENKLFIDDYISILNKTFDKSMPDNKRKELKKEKAKARNSIMNFTVGMYGHIVRNCQKKMLKISKYEEIPILGCDYNSKTGIENLVYNNKNEDYSDRSF